MKSETEHTAPIDKPFASTVSGRAEVLSTLIEDGLIKSPGMIYQKMVDIMRDIGAIAKDQRNKSQGFDYRGIEDLYNALHSIKAKHGVFDCPTILEDRTEDRKTSKGNNLIYRVLKVRFRFTADDGSFVDCVTIGEGMDSGDKASNKAMSVAHKYALLIVFNIPTQQIMDDPDADSPGADGLEAPDPVFDVNDEKHVTWINKFFETNKVPFAKWDDVGSVLVGKPMRGVVNPLLADLYSFIKSESPEKLPSPELIDAWIARVKK